jgi:deferrochelatase/peroxidase EfeB
MAPQRPSRRAFLGAAGGSLALAGLVGCSDNNSGTLAATPPSGTPRPVSPTGDHQAGIVTPNPAQAHLLTVVYDANHSHGSAIARIGQAVIDLTSGRDAHLAGLDPADLTVTVGVGPHLVRGAPSQVAAALPTFRNDVIPASGNGGDVMVQLCASDPLVLPGAAAAIAAAAGADLIERWRQSAFRGPAVTVRTGQYAPRNLLGFVDGIVVARTPSQLTAGVWMPRGQLAGGSVCVVRRMELDLDGFTALTVEEQEDVIGRRRASAVPLSGGTIATDPDLGAKTPVGAYVIPADAHLRRANSDVTGVPTMLRRSYSFQDSAAGLFFVSFQNDVNTFIKTMQRMSDSDALLDFATTTRSAAFAILPGFSESRPLGRGLLA